MYSLFLLINYHLQLQISGSVFSYSFLILTTSLYPSPSLSPPLPSPSTFPLLLLRIWQLSQLLEGANWQKSSLKLGDRFTAR